MLRKEQTLIMLADDTLSSSPSELEEELFEFAQFWKQALYPEERRLLFWAATVGDVELTGLENSFRTVIWNRTDLLVQSLQAFAVRLLSLDPRRSSALLRTADRLVGIAQHCGVPVSPGLIRIEETSGLLT